MAASITSIQKLGTKMWRYDYSGTSRFKRYIKGVLYEGRSSADTFLIVVGDSDVEPVPVEIIDSTENEEDVSQVKYPQRAVLQWRAATGTAYYKIQKSVSGVWTDVRIIHHRPNSIYFKWQSPQLDDVTTHQYRVMAYTASGDEGVPIPMDVSIVRNPDPPEVTISLAGGTLTVAAV